VRGEKTLLFPRDFWRRHRAPHEKESILSLLNNHSVDRATNITRISPDPTAIEFRNVFNDLLSACCGKGLRLVIVIDNLDRLVETDAMQLWATIRSLFLGNNPASANGTLRAPAIVLPIDPAAITRMFAASETDDHDDSKAAALADAFIDKTFDITFQVNEPVRSDWREFLAEKLRDAFGSRASSLHIYWTTRFVEDAHSGNRAARELTPRKLIKLVNSIAALVVQWTDEIAFLSIVYFVVNRRLVTNDVVAFVKTEVPSMEANVPDWQRQIAALHYGVEPDKAYQAMLAGPMREAIGALDQEVFDKLVTSPGAPAVGEETLSRPPRSASGSAADGTFVANAALLLNQRSGRQEQRHGKNCKGEPSRSRPKRLVDQVEIEEAETDRD
jgi:hypothetical protein